MNTIRASGQSCSESCPMRVTEHKACGDRSVAADTSSIRNLRPWPDVDGHIYLFLESAYECPLFGLSGHANGQSCRKKPWRGHMLTIFPRPAARAQLFERRDTFLRRQDPLCRPIHRTLRHRFNSKACGNSPIFGLYGSNQTGTLHNGRQHIRLLVETSCCLRLLH